MDYYPNMFVTSMHSRVRQTHYDTRSRQNTCNKKPRSFEELPDEKFNPMQQQTVGRKPSMLFVPQQTDVPVQQNTLPPSSRESRGFKERKTHKGDSYNVRVTGGCYDPTKDPNNI